MIQLTGVHFGYEQSLFSDLNLEVLPGKLTGLLGKNGSGKTTLLKILCGLMAPANGSVSVLGWEPRLRQSGFLSKIFFVPEQVELPDLSPGRMAKVFGSLYPHFDHQKYEELMLKLEVPKRESPSQMSFGQKRKALLALGLAAQTPVLLLDEPSNGFDINAQVELRRLLQECSSPNRSILISTHHIREFESVLDDVIILDAGRIQLHKSSAELEVQQGKKDLEAVFVQATGSRPDFDSTEQRPT